MFKNIYYKCLVWLAYKAGDLLCHLDYEWSYNLYQKCMLFSYEHDERIDFWLWKEPAFKDDDDL